jgi:hypothetical protein
MRSSPRLWTGRPRQSSPAIAVGIVRRGRWQSQRLTHSTALASRVALFEAAFCWNSG